MEPPRTLPSSARAAPPSSLGMQAVRWCDCTALARAAATKAEESPVRACVQCGAVRAGTFRGGPEGQKSLCNKYVGIHFSAASRSHAPLDADCAFTPSASTCRSPGGVSSEYPFKTSREKRRKSTAQHQPRRRPACLRTSSKSACRLCQTTDRGFLRSRDRWMHKGKRRKLESRHARGLGEQTRLLLLACMYV